jgi:hypothetical protein
MSASLSVVWGLEILRCSTHAFILNLSTAFAPPHVAGCATMLALRVLPGISLVPIVKGKYTLRAFLSVLVINCSTHHYELTILYDHENRLQSRKLKMQSPNELD